MQKDTQKSLKLQEVQSSAKSCPLNTIKVGQVDFINCLPINISFEEYSKKNNIKTINAIPSKLNEMILNGEIDIAPISSYAYLQNKNNLTPIADLCIASDGPADSVLLFSNKKIDDLNNCKIALSHASATSNKLLQIVLNKFMDLDCEYTIEDKTVDELKNNYDASLLIGDRALVEYSKNGKLKYIYDLGELWKTYTKLPMVFAVWVIRNEKLNENRELALEISKVLNKCLNEGLTTNFDKVLREANKSLEISEEFYRFYFEHLKYDFNEDCKTSLKKLEEYL